MSASALGIVASSKNNAVSGPAGYTGKTLWLDPNDLGSAGALTLWPDRSPVGCSTVLLGAGPIIQTAQTPGGRKAVYFAGSGVRGLDFLRTDLGVATASSTYAAGFDPSYAIDANGSSYWHSANTSVPAWWQIQVPTAIVSTSLTIGVWGTTGPNTFKIQGSNDGTNWDDLSSLSGITYTSNEVKVFNFTNATAYNRYRIWITVVNGDGYSRLETVRFNNIPSIGATANADGEFWIRLKSSYSVNAFAYGAFEMGSNGQSSHFGYGGQIYDDTGWNQRLNFVTTMDINAWRTYRVRISGTTWSAYLDDVLQYTTTITAGIWPGTPRIGESRQGAGWDGVIAGVMIYNRALTAPEAAATSAYFAAL